MFQDVHTITLASCVKTLSLNLWDEERQKLISFRQCDEHYVQQGASNA
jgi:hypothetical protein